MPDKAKFKKFILGWLLVLFISSCGNQTNSQKLLDASFLQSGLRTYQIVAPPNISQGIQFDLIVNSLVGNQINVGAKGDLSWSMSMGAGTVTVINAPGFTNGQQRITLRYDNAALAYGSSEVVVLKAADKNDSTQTGSSNAITAIGPATLASFQITAPSSAPVSTDFSVTIKAIGTDGNTYTAFTGCVNVTPSVIGGTTGVLSVSTVCGFVAGVASTNVNFNQTAASLILQAQDSITSKTGSTLVNIMLSDFTLIGVPIPGSSSVRLNWTKVSGVSYYNIYRTGVTPPLATITDASNILTYLDTSLTSGITYAYRVDALNSSAQVIKQVTYTVTLGSCTALASLSVDTTLTKAASPYCPAGTVTVTSAKLTLQPGTIIEFPAGASLTIGSAATLVSQGTVSDPVIFTSNSSNPTSPAWRGIIFASNAVPSTMTINLSGNEAVSEVFSSGSIISNSVIEFAGGNPGSAITTAVPLWLESNLMRLNKNTGAGSPAGGGAVGATFTSNTQWLVVRSGFFVGNTFAGTGDGGGDIWNKSNFGHASIRANSFVNSLSAADGGSIYLYSAQNTIASNTFNNATNTVGSGSAIYIDGDNQVIKANSISNGSGFLSGAIYFNNGANALISGNTFYNILGATWLVGGRGGGLRFTGSVSSATISGNTFTSTRATFGGAIDLNGTGHVVTGNTFTSTLAAPYSGGATGAGAICVCGGSNHLVTLNTFTSSSVDPSTNMTGGALNITGTSNVTVTYNLFKTTYTSASGSGAGGGAIYVNSPGVSISHNTFDGTSTQSDTHFGGAIYVDGGATGILIRLNNFLNTAAKGNSAKGGAIFIQNFSPNNAAIQHNNFSNSTIGAAGTTQNVFGTNQNLGTTINIDTGQCRL